MLENSITSEEWPKLIDPITKQPLEDYNITKDTLKSGETNEFIVPVINGIPRFVLNSTNYTEAFGEQWNKWTRTQLDSYTGTDISRKRLTRVLGDKGMARLNKEGTTINVLEVGCGAGRFTEILLEYSNIRLDSMDMSNAVDANLSNCPISNRHRIIQADIERVPFCSNTFDIVICVGVIQHTPSPEKTIKILFDLVKPGGILVFDHYTYEIRRMTKISMLILRPIIKRIPAKYRLALIELLVTVFFPIHRSVRGIPAAQMILSRLSPITTYFHAYPELTDQHQREWSVLDTHDGLTDWYKHLRTKKQLYNCLKEIGGHAISLNRGGNGIEGFCEKLQTLD